MGACSIKADHGKRDTSLIDLRETRLALLAGGLGGKGQVESAGLSPSRAPQKGVCFQHCWMNVCFPLIYSNFWAVALLGP